MNQIPPEQKRLFDFERDEVRRATDDAIRQSAEGASKDWLETMLSIMYQASVDLARWSTDEIWRRYHKLCEQLCIKIETRDSRALGVAIIIAQRRGWIRFSGKYQKSARKVCHENPKRIWESRIYRGPAEAA